MDLESKSVFLTLVILIYVWIIANKRKKFSFLPFIVSRPPKQKNISLVSKNKYIALQEYDVVGRESNRWLPGTSSGNGAYVTPETVKTSAKGLNGDQNPYSLPVYEASPLNRILEQYGPGTAWQINSRSAKTAYLANVSGNDTLNCVYYKVSDTSSTTDSVVTVTLAGNYATAELYVTRTADEDGNTSFEFKDKLGQVVLTRQLVRSGSTKIPHDTYYVYDDFGNLTAVLPPLASDNMNSGTSWTNANSAVLRNYAYLYMYDGRNRCKAKRLPGCAWTYYVYDTADRLIFSQDGSQRAAGIWSFNIPDIFGRTCVSGTCTGSYDALALTSPLNGIVVKAIRSNTTDTYKGYASSFGITLTSPTVLSVNYYDDYAFIGSNGIDSGITAYDAQTGFDTRYTVSAKTFLTGTLTAQLLPDGTVSSTYLYSVMYYDYKGRVIQTKGNNPLSGGTEKAYIAYNFTGQPLQKKHIHAATGKDTQTELYTYTYDDALRLKTTQYSLNKGAAVTLASNTYDELGRLLTTQRNGQSSLKTNYAYNVRSWLKSSSSPLFNQTLYYNDTYAGSTARYNGNISAMSWKMSNETQTRGYKFTYDNLSRLTAAGYLEGGTANDHFNTSYVYDKQGNMTALTHRGNTGTSTYGLIDNLAMTYAGNQLIKAEDTGVSVSLSASMDFKNNSNTAREYNYDANGNLTQDLNKGINSITYNLLNLPQTLTISNSMGSATNSYTYAADGRKLKTMIGSKTTDYCGNVIYENGVLKRILVEGGYIEGGAYYFYLTDHLGNNRVVVDASGNIKQTNHYYPFGMSFAEGAVTSSQPYKYNGKELDTDRGLNLYDYSARYMDPALGRFNTVDPMAEKYYSISPYVYVGNNPLKRTDPTGTDWYTSIDGSATIWKKGSADIEGYKNIGANYTQNIDDHTTLTYTQNEATSITYTGIEEDNFVAQGTGTGCKIASDQMLANEGVNSNGERINVVNADANGVATTATANATRGINAIDKALENGNPIEVGVDYKPKQVNNLKPNGDGMTDHFIVVSSKTETLSNGQITSKTYNFFDPRSSANGRSSSNQLHIENNKMVGTYNYAPKPLNYTVTTIRRNR